MASGMWVNLCIAGFSPMPVLVPGRRRLRFNLITLLYLRCRHFCMNTFNYINRSGFSGVVFFLIHDTFRSCQVWRSYSSVIQCTSYGLSFCFSVAKEAAIHSFYLKMDLLRKSEQTVRSLHLCSHALLILNKKSEKGSTWNLGL